MTRAGDTASQLEFYIKPCGGLSQSLMLRLQGKAAMSMYSQFEKGRDQGDFSILPELHSILSGLKVMLGPYRPL